MVPLLLFSCIPLVLVLFIRQPLGPGWSVLLGLAIMAAHRRVAMPWAAARSSARCLWCGRPGASAPLAVRSSGRTWDMRACGADHGDAIARSLTAVERYRVPIALGIFVPLGWLIAASLASAVGHPLRSHDETALIFRTVVAFTVIAATLIPVAGHVPAHSASGSAGPRLLVCPFPVHNLFLLGIRNTFWIFRIVGAWWLLDAAWRLVR